MNETWVIVSLVVIAAILIVLLLRERRLLRETEDDRDQVRDNLNRMSVRFRDVLDADAERSRISGEVVSLLAQKSITSNEIGALQKQLAAMKADLATLDEETTLYSFGLYKPHYDFADSARYVTELDRIRDQQKAMIKDKTAATCATAWEVNGSKVEGRKSINQTLKLMLRAFNGECDAAIAKVKYNNISVMETRIQKAFDAITALATVQTCQIAQA